MDSNKEKDDRYYLKYKVDEKENNIYDKEYIEKSKKELIETSKGHYSSSLIISLLKCYLLKGSVGNVPGFILDPKSMLEVLSEGISPEKTRIGIKDIKDPYERFKAILKKVCLIFRKLPRETILCAKPYNPILGEVCYAKSKDETVHTHAEQISHHPPCSAIYSEDQHNGTIFSAYIGPRLKFHGINGIAMDATTHSHTEIQIPSLKETYCVKWPDFIAKSIIVGSAYVEIGGKASIECPQTGYSILIQFKAGNKCSGTIKNREKKKIGKIEGNFMTTIMLDNDILIDNQEEMKEMIYKGVHEQRNNETRKVWHRVTKAMRENCDFEKAGLFKSELEQHMRDLKQQRDYTPAYFEQKEKHWVYKKKEKDWVLPENGYWNA